MGNPVHLRSKAFTDYLISKIKLSVNTKSGNSKNLKNNGFIEANKSKEKVAHTVY